MTDEQSNDLAKQMAAQSDEELLIVVGFYELQQMNIEALMGRDAVIQLGRSVLDANRAVRTVICRAENKKAIARAVDVGQVGSMAGLIASVWGGGSADHAQVAAPVVALATLMLRIGINEYCRGQKLARPPRTPRVRRKTQKPATEA